MKTTLRFFFAILLISLIGGATTVSAEVKVEEQIVGPLAEKYNNLSPYAISPRGVRLATVAARGSRVVAIVDGVEGPKFDEIVATSGYVDARPLLDAQHAAAAAGRPGPDTTTRLVIFSKDGKRYAYAGRLGQEWVLIVDGKEMLRTPVANGVKGVEWTGGDGKHLMFAKSLTEGNELWVDGQKIPVLFLGGGTGDPVISRDGARYAYVGGTAQKRVLIVDGKDVGYMGEDPQFSADSRSLFTIARDKPSEQVLLVDGKPSIRALRIMQLYVPPVGNKLVTVLAQPMPDGTQKYFCVVDGKKVDATDSTSIPTVVHSPDGKHYAVAVTAANNVAFVVVDGKRGQQYDGIWQPESFLAFSPDSSKVAYVARSAGKFFIVINEQESDAFDGAALKVFFSPDGKRVAYCGIRQSPAPGGFKLYVDGKLERIDGQADCGSFAFSPDGSRYAYAASPNGNLYLDGKPTGLHGDKFAFTPDSKRLAGWGNQPAPETKPEPLSALRAPAQQGLFMDSQHVYGDMNSMNLRYRAFTPESQHMYWMTLERPTGPNAKPGLIEAVLYLDGRPVVRTDRIDSGAGAGLYPSGSYQFLEPPPAWEVSSDGVLTFLAPVGDVIKRFRITPSSDTNIATMITAAEAEAAKAKAEPEAAKPQGRGRRR